MDKNDLNKFSEAWRGLSELQSGSVQSEAATLMAFRILKRFDLNETLRAMRAHAEGNSWMPSPHDIIAIVEPPEPELTPEILAGLARASNTPLGAYVAYKVTAFDMHALNDFQLLSRIKTLLPKIEEFASQFRSGELSPDSKRLMEQKGLMGASGLTVAIESVKPTDLLPLTHDNAITDPEVNRMVNSIFGDMPQ